MFVIFRQPTRAGRKPQAPPTVVDAIAIDGPWKVDFQSGRGAPASITLPTLTSWTAHSDAGVRYFSGNAKYSKRFTVPAGWREARLDLGKLWAVGDIWLNGKPLGIVWTPPYAVDCTAALRDGENELVVEVTNTWFNRLAGDAKLPESQRITRTNTPSSGGTPWTALDPIDSGLFGPVRLERLR